MTDHAPDKHERRFPTLAVVLCVGMVFLPVLYVLSIGPAWRCVGEGYLSNSAYEAIYAPLIYLAMRFQFIYDVVNAYTRLWR